MPQIVSLQKYRQYLKGDEADAEADLDYPGAETMQPLDNLGDDTAEGDIVSRYLKDLRKGRVLSADEERCLFLRIKQGDFAARQKMIEHNLFLVVSIAKVYAGRYAARGVDLLDLIEEGNLGLIHAIGKFDPQKGFRFSTYAVWWIRENIETAIMYQSRLVRIPIRVQREFNGYLREAYAQEKESHKVPSLAAVAGALNMTQADVEKLVQFFEAPVSLDAAMGEENNRSLKETLPGEERQQPEEQIFSAQVMACISQGLSQLHERHREVIERRFGLNGQDVEKVECMAKRMGISTERVRQIQHQAFKALIKILEAQGYSKSCLL